jgi:hypothetical protein
MINPCDNLIDPMAGVNLPAGVVAVETFVDGETIWTLDPPPVVPLAPVFLLLQSGGPLLMQDEIPLAIETV